MQSQQPQISILGNLFTLLTELEADRLAIEKLQEQLKTAATDQEKITSAITTVKQLQLARIQQLNTLLQTQINWDDEFKRYDNVQDRCVKLQSETDKECIARLRKLNISLSGLIDKLKFLEGILVKFDNVSNTAVMSGNLDRLNNKIKTYKKVLEHAQQKANATLKDTLGDLDPIEENTVVLYVWYRKGTKPGDRKIFYLDSTGHASIALRRTKYDSVNGKIDEISDLSFYTDNTPIDAEPGIAQRIMKPIANAIHMPVPKDTKGYSVNRENDLLRLEEGGDYDQVEKVTIRCKNGIPLNLDAMAKEIERIKKEETVYNFLTGNCADQVRKVLAAGGFILPRHQVITSPRRLIDAFKEIAASQVEGVEVSSYKKRVQDTLAIVINNLTRLSNNPHRNDCNCDKTSVTTFLNKSITDLTSLLGEIKLKNSPEEIDICLQSYSENNDFSDTDRNKPLESFIQAEALTNIYKKLKKYLPTCIDSTLKTNVEIFNETLEIIAKTWPNENKDDELYLLLKNNKDTLNKYMEIYREAPAKQGKRLYVFTLLKFIHNLISSIDNIEVTDNLIGKKKASLKMLREIQANLHELLYPEFNLNSQIAHILGQQIFDLKEAQKFLDLKCKEDYKAKIKKAVTSQDCLGDKLRQIQQSTDDVTAAYWLSNRDDYNTLNFRAQFVTVLKAFRNGELDREEYLKELTRLLTLPAPTSALKNLRNYIYIFKKQFLLDVMEVTGVSLASDKFIQPYMYYDFESDTLNGDIAPYIHTYTNPHRFADKFPKVTREQLARSADVLVCLALKPILKEPYYLIEMGDFRYGLFARAFRDGLNSDNEAYSKLKAKYDELTNQKSCNEILFCLLIETLELHKKIISDELTPAAIEAKIGELEQRIPKDFSYKNHLYNLFETIQAAANTLNYKTLMIAQDLEAATIITVNAGKTEETDAICTDNNTIAKTITSSVRNASDVMANVKKIHIENLSQQIVNNRSLAATNRYIYFNSAMCKLVGNFLGITDAEYSNIELIIAKAKGMDMSSQANYKLELIKILEAFISDGSIEEKEFHHQLSRFIERHKPTSKWKIINLLSTLREKEDDKTKHRNMHYLREFRKEFVKIYQKTMEEIPRESLPKAHTVFKNQTIQFSSEEKLALDRKANEKLIKLYSKNITHYFGLNFGIFARSKKAINRDEAKIQLKSYNHTQFKNLQ